MTISNLGINRFDFELQAFEDFKQEVERTPRIKSTSNETGSPTYADGTKEEIRAIFRKRSQTFDWAKEGLFEGGDAFMQVLLNQDLNKEDIIEVNDEKFRVDNVIIRTIGDEQMFKSANLYYY